MKRVFLLICLSCILCGCNNISKEEQIQELMNNNEYVVLDVRTKEEYDESHVVDSINIPYDEIDENIDIDKDKIVFVYCKSGKRSAIAYNSLEDLGYQVYDLGAFSELSLAKE